MSMIDKQSYTKAEYLALWASHTELLANLSDVIKIIRCGTLGDYYSIMDRVYDSEQAISNAMAIRHKEIHG